MHTHTHTDKSIHTKSPKIDAKLLEKSLCKSSFVTLALTLYSKSGWMKCWFWLSHEYHDLVAAYVRLCMRYCQLKIKSIKSYSTYAYAFDHVIA